jgi:hypothetical protein
MKAIKKITPVLSLVVMLTILSLSGCDKGTDKSVAEVNTQILTSHTWKLQSLMADNVDKTSLYTGMTLTVTATGYTTTKGSPVWNPSGTWSFVTDEGVQIKREDGINVTIKEISEDKLVLEMDWAKTTFGGGRVSSVTGHHVFTFVK